MSSEIRVLVAVGTLGIGGAEGQILQICRALGGRDFRFDIVTINAEDGPLAAELKDSGARVHSLRVGKGGSGRTPRLLRLLRAIPHFRSLLKELRPDLVHAYLPEMSVVAAASRWPRLRPPLIVSKRTLVRWIARDPIYFPIARWTNRRADLVLANSEAVRQDVISKEGADPGRLRVLHNGVDTDRFRPDPPEEGLARELSLPAGTPVIGMVANLHSYKGHADMVEAARILRDRGLKFTLLLVGGDGDASENVRRKIRDAGLAEDVRLAGPRTDVPRLLRLFDVFVSASHEEGFSNSILEAMASGRTIVATSVGGTVEQIEDGVSGFIVEPRNPEGLASALLRLFQDPALRTRLGTSARAAAVQRFSLSRLSEQTSSLYRNAIDQSARHALLR